MKEVAGSSQATGELLRAISEVVRESRSTATRAAPIARQAAAVSQAKSDWAVREIRLSDEVLHAVGAPYVAAASKVRGTTWSDLTYTANRRGQSTESIYHVVESAAAPEPAYSPEPARAQRLRTGSVLDLVPQRVKLSEDLRLMRNFWRNEGYHV